MHDFIPKLIKHSVTLFFSIIIVMAMFVGLAFATLTIIGSLQTKKSPESAVLIFDMGMTINDTPHEANPFGPLFGKYTSDKASLMSLVDAIYKAADDKNIKALYLAGARPYMPDTGLSSIAELQTAIAHFRESGKPVYAYLQDADMREYALASSASQIWMNPMCALEMEGFSAERLYFGEAFKRYGIGIQTASAGKYKSAPDSFAQDHMRPADREQLKAFLDDVWSNYKTVISDNRHIDESVIEDLSQNKGIISAKAAVELRLVDKLADYDEFVTQMQGLSGKDGNYFKCIGINYYMNQQSAPKLADSFKMSKAKVSVEYIEGDIVDGEGSWSEAGCDRIINNLRDLRSDSKVKAVVLRVNSPGGGAIASEKIRREVALLAERVPVVVSMGHVAASGGYWVSAPAKKIYAEPTTLTGSIGVFSILINFEDMADDWGVHSDNVGTSPFANINSIFAEKDENQMKIFNGFVDDIYGEFLQIVSKGRKMDVDKVSAIAEGRIWSGLAARENGLVDEIGGLDDAIDAAAELANLGDDYTVEEMTVPVSFEDQLGELMNSHAMSSSMTPAKKIAASLESVAGQIKQTGAFARLPFFTQGNW